MHDYELKPSQITFNGVKAFATVIATYFFVEDLGKGQGFAERIAPHRENVLSGTVVEPADVAALDILLQSVDERVRFFQPQ